jgi:hypothetical protein
MSKSVVYRLVCEGRIPAHWAGCEWRFDTEEPQGRSKLGKLAAPWECEA